MTRTKTGAEQTSEPSNKFFFNFRKQFKYEKTHEPINFRKKHMIKQNQHTSKKRKNWSRAGEMKFCELQ